MLGITAIGKLKVGINIVKHIDIVGFYHSSIIFLRHSVKICYIILGDIVFNNEAVHLAACFHDVLDK